MELTYLPVNNYPFYCIPQCTYLQLLSRSKNPVYLYQHKQSRQKLVVKQIPFDQSVLAIYSIIKQLQNFQSIIKIKGMCILSTKQPNYYKNYERDSLKQNKFQYNSSNILYPQNQNQNQFNFVPQNNSNFNSSNLFVHQEHFLDNKKQIQQYHQKNAEKRTLLIWMEYYSYNLTQYIHIRRKERKPFTKKEAGKFLLQTITILQALQRKGFSHRDIKPGNILYQSQKYRLCDFDEAIIIDNKNSNKSNKCKRNIPLIEPTTFSYCSPAFLLKIYNRKQGYNDQKYFCPFKLDVYALGLTFLYFCSMGRFDVQQRLSFVQNKIVHEEFMRQQRRKFVKQNPNYSCYNVLLKAMLEEDEYKRDDFVFLMMKIRNGFGNIVDIVSEQLCNNQEISNKALNKNDYIHKNYSEQDISQAVSNYNKQKHKFIRHKKGKRNYLLGAKKRQGCVLLSMLICASSIYFLLFLL